jgi:hypothetical protein
MNRISVSLAALAAVLMSAPVTAQDNAPRVFTRSGQWSLEAAADECRLARAFTNGSDQISLALERNRADNQVRLIGW